MEKETVYSTGSMSLAVNGHIVLSSDASAQSFTTGFNNGLVAALNNDVPVEDQIATSQVTTEVAISETGGIDVTYKVGYEVWIPTGELVKQDLRRRLTESAAMAAASASGDKVTAQASDSESTLMQGEVTGSVDASSVTTATMAVVENCSYSSYSDWSSCSLVCGGGSTQQVRSIEAWPKNGGVECDDDSLTVIETCNTFDCNLCETFSDDTLIQIPGFPEHGDVSACDIDKDNTACLVQACVYGYVSNTKSGTITCDIAQGPTGALTYSGDSTNALFCSSAKCSAGSPADLITIPCSETGGVVSGSTNACVCTCNPGYSGDDCATVPTCTCTGGTEAVATDGSCEVDAAEDCTACNTGYTLDGQVCNVNTCSNTPAAPTDGTVVFSATNDNGSIATFACNPPSLLSPSGFAQSGDATVTCAATTSNLPWGTATNPPTCTGQQYGDTPPTPDALEAGLNEILTDVTVTLPGSASFVIATSGTGKNTVVAVSETGVVTVTFSCDSCSASSVPQDDQTAINNAVICPGLFVKNSCADEYDFVWTDGSIVITVTPIPDDGSDDKDIIVVIMVVFVGVAVLLLVLVAVCVCNPSCSASPKPDPVAQGGSTALYLDHPMETGGAVTRPAFEAASGPAALHGL